MATSYCKICKFCCNFQSCAPLWPEIHGMHTFQLQLNGHAEHELTCHINTLESTAIMLHPYRRYLMILSLQTAFQFAEDPFADGIYPSFNSSIRHKCRHGTHMLPPKRIKMWQICGKRLPKTSARFVPVTCQPKRLSLLLQHQVPLAKRSAKQSAHWEKVQRQFWNDTNGYKRILDDFGWLWGLLGNVGRRSRNNFSRHAPLTKLLDLRVELQDPGHNPGQSLVRWP